MSSSVFRYDAKTYASITWQTIISFWKSLQGAGNDWPLALCDARTMNHDSDTITADVVYHNRYLENEFVFYKPEHRWYYVKDLQDDEIIMFVQQDSGIQNGAGENKILLTFLLHDFELVNRVCANVFLVSSCSAFKFL